ncbi:hypothetical protein [Shouchella miscanthi]|uniref:Uncharacterized protein n=1 Tax=Shouchella miscanthi TaxID=2598861 RepID=A0ABU6NKH0_9BACI|nr:hypothetical protein [Shouchella miscanthi]
MNYEKEFTDVKERIRQYEKWHAHLDRIRPNLEEQTQKAKQLKTILQDKQQDVDRLSGLSFSSLLHAVTGRKAEKIDEATALVLKAQLKYEEAEETMTDLHHELEEIDAHLHSLGNPKADFQRLLDLKKDVLLGEKNTALHSLVEAASTTTIYMNEIKEATEVGQKAKQALKSTIFSLNKASDWSTFDLFGGGFLTTAMKHSHVDDAKALIHQVQRHLRQFEEELKDVNQFTSFQIELTGFLTFADYFFDGFIVDWMVHGKIKDSHEQAVTLLAEVETTLSQLATIEKELHSDLEDIRKQKRAFILNA